MKSHLVKAQQLSCCLGQYRCRVGAQYTAHQSFDCIYNQIETHQHKFYNFSKCAVQWQTHTEVYIQLQCNFAMLRGNNFLYINTKYKYLEMKPSLVEFSNIYAEFSAFLPSFLMRSFPTICNNCRLLSFQSIYSISAHLSFLQQLC